MGRWTKMLSIIAVYVSIQVQADGKEIQNLILKDTVTFTGAITSSIANISDNGKKVFIVMQGGTMSPVPSGDVPQPPYQLAALYQNNKGKLELIHSINTHASNFAFGFGGGATPDFKNFVVQDFNQNFETGFNTSRIRLFDSSLKKVVAQTRIPKTRFNDPRIAFSTDGQVFAVSLLDEVTGNIFIRVYQTKTLEVITDYSVGPFYANAVNMGTYFQILKKGKENEYFAFSFASTPDFFITLTYASMQILAFDRNARSLTLVSDTPLPQIGPAMGAFRPPRGTVLPNAFLTVGTNRADLPCEPITLQVPANSLLTGDGDELRYYRWNGVNGTPATLVASQNVTMDVSLAEPSPFNKGQSIAMDFKNLPQASGTGFGPFHNPNPGGNPYLGFFQIRQVTNESPSGVAPKGINSTVGTYFAGLFGINANLQAQFSLNGKWLVVAGSTGQQNEPAPVSEVFFGTTAMVQLFEVVR